MIDLTISITSHLLVIFPSMLDSGHEKIAEKHFVDIKPGKMFTKVIRRADTPRLAIFMWRLYLQRKSCRKALLINGSPFGNTMLKLYLKLLRFHLIEYTPFPELREMKDRKHHVFIGPLNKLIVDERILIDDWQLEFSQVPINYVVKNYV